MSAANRKILLLLTINFALSWTVLPLLIPPGGAYPPVLLLEALQWQALGLLAWPLALLGGCLSSASAVMAGGTPGLSASALLPLLLYPAIWGLLALALGARRKRGWVVALLHLLLALSFALVWLQVRQGVAWVPG